MVRRVFDFNLGFAYPVRIMDQKDEAWIEQRLLDRFLRYVRIDTTSDGHSKSSPTTPGHDAAEAALVGLWAAVRLGWRAMPALK